MVATTIRDNILDIKERIALAAERAGRKSSDVTLIAVTKNHPVEAMEEAVRTGLIDAIGENRVQEALGKHEGWPSDLSVSWNLIGHLQRNKARKAVEIFDMIQSVDSLRLGNVLDRLAAEEERLLPVLMEVNTSGEESKNGISPEKAEALAVDLIKNKHLDLRGLMTIGPLSDDEVKVRCAFARLRGLREMLGKNLGISLPVLSMGMSGDFEWAIEEGSTMVRIGTAIFGARA